MSRDDGKDENIGMFDRILDKVKDMFGFISEEKINNIEDDIKILKDTSDKIQKDIKNVKEKLKKDIISDLEAKLEPILKNYSEQYLEKRNDRYLEEYRNIEKYLISAKEETIEVLKKDKEKFENNLQEKNKRIEELEEELTNLKTQLNLQESGMSSLEKEKRDLNQNLKEAQERIETLNDQLSSRKNILNDLEEEKGKLSQELKEKEKEKENLRNQLNSQENEVNGLEEEKNNLSQDLKDVQERLETLKVQLNSKEIEVNNLKEEKNSLNKDLERKKEEFTESKTEIDVHKRNIISLEEEKTKLNEELSNVMSRIYSLESTIKEKEKEIENLENKSQKEIENTLNERKDVENRLQDFIEKIETPYEELLNAISENSKSKEIEEYLKFKNDRGLSKSMIIFSLINEDALARKIASFYAEKKEIMMDEDFKIIKEVNKIYENDKAWGILYAEPEGKYLSSLVRDRKSSDIYKTFVAMYSPAYRKDEDGNSPLKGIVDGKK